MAMIFPRVGSREQPVTPKVPNSSQESGKGSGKGKNKKQVTGPRSDGSELQGSIPDESTKLDMKAQYIKEHRERMKARKAENDKATKSAKMSKTASASLLTRQRDSGGYSEVK